MALTLWSDGNCMDIIVHRRYCPWPTLTGLILHGDKYIRGRWTSGLLVQPQKAQPRMFFHGSWGNSTSAQPAKMMVQFSAAITDSILTSSITTGATARDRHPLLRRWPAATIRLSKPAHLWSEISNTCCDFYCFKQADFSGWVRTPESTTSKVWSHPNCGTLQNSFQRDVPSVCFAHPDTRRLAL